MLLAGESSRAMLASARLSCYHVALKLLRIVTKVFVTFHEYMWTKKCLKIQLSPLVFPIWQLENGNPTKKAQKILY